MQTLSYKGYEGTVEVDVENGVCRGKLLFVKDLITYVSETPKGLKAAFEESVDDYLETCQELGREPQRPFRGAFNVRVPPDMHRAAAVRAARDEVTLNEIMVRALDCYLNSRADVQHNVTIKLGDVRTIVAGADQPLAWNGVMSHDIRH